MPHIKGNYSLIFRHIVIWTVSLLTFIGVSGCLDEPDLKKRVEIKGDNFTCENCYGFGRYIEIQGNSLVIADRQTLFMFERNAGAWNLVQEIKYDSSTKERSGYILDIVLQPSLLVIGVEGYEGNGKVELFERMNDGSWSKFQELSAGQPQDRFGNSIHVVNDQMVIGASAPAGDTEPGPLFNRNTDIGRAYIYKLENNSWILKSELKSTNSKPDDWFGNAVCLVGDYALVSSKEDSIQVFNRNGDNWSFRQFLPITRGIALASFGNEIMISGRGVIAMTLESTSQEFVGRTIEVVDEHIPNNIFYSEGSGDIIELYHEYALVSGSYWGGSFLFKLNGNNWSLDREFDFDGGLAISDQFIALGAGHNAVNLYPR